MGGNNALLIGFRVLPLLSSLGPVCSACPCRNRSLAAGDLGFLSALKRGCMIRQRGCEVVKLLFHAGKWHLPKQWNRQDSTSKRAIE